MLLGCNLTRIAITRMNKGMSYMFEIERFTADCHAAMQGTDSMLGVREIVAEAVSDPTGLLKVLGEPERGTVQCLHKSHDLTILKSSGRRA